MNSLGIMCLILSVIFLILGLIFALLKEKATILISGFNFKSKEERKQYDQVSLSLDHRNLFLFWSMLFFIGALCSMVSQIISIIIFLVWFILFCREVHFDDEKAFGKYKLKE